MKRLLIIIFLVIPITIIAQDGFAISQLPEWFMRPTADSYIGISAPASNEQDAINMALFQILMAHEFTAQCQEIAESYYEESINKSTGKTINSCRMTIDTTISYSVQNLSKLESGEYVCRVKNGGTLQHPIKIVWERFIKSYSKDGDIDYSERRSCNCTMDNWQFVMKTTRLITGNSEMLDSTDVYSFASLFENRVAEDYVIKSIYANPDPTQEQNFKYSFPSSIEQEYKNTSSVFFPLSKDRSLFEQMLSAYWQILYDGFVEAGDAFTEKTPNNGTTYHLHKATPLLGFNYNYGVFEIQYKK